MCNAVFSCNFLLKASMCHAGPIAPVLFAAWTTAFITSLTHFPYTVEGRDW